MHSMCSTVRVSFELASKLNVYSTPTRVDAWNVVGLAEWVNSWDHGPSKICIGLYICLAPCSMWLHWFLLLHVHFIDCWRSVYIHIVRLLWAILIGLDHYGHMILYESQKYDGWSSNHGTTMVVVQWQKPWLYIIPWFNRRIFGILNVSL